MSARPPIPRDACPRDPLPSQAKTGGRDDQVDDPGGHADSGPIADYRRNEWWRSLDTGLVATSEKTPMIPNRWLSESRHVCLRFVDCRPRGKEYSPSASSSEDVLRAARPIRQRTGLRWARSTDADGEGDVREACDIKSAPVALDKGSLIDACPSSYA